MINFENTDVNSIENMVESMHAQIECLKERVLILEQREIHREENKCQ